MTKQLGTLWLIGFMATVISAAGCLDTVHDHGRGGGGGGSACADYQYFTVQWGIDHGQGTLALTCAQIGPMASHVELTTNAVAPDDVLIPSYNIYCQDGATCSDGSPCNMFADTVSGLPVGTFATMANLIGNDGSLLSSALGQGADNGIKSCDGVVLPFTFGIAP